jgi:hypothetical protein
MLPRTMVGGGARHGGKSNDVLVAAWMSGWCRGDGEETLVVFPAAGSATLGIELGWGQWGGGSEPRVWSPWPSPPLIGTVRQGPTSQEYGWTPPIMAQVKVQVAVGLSWWEINLTFFPLISPYTVTLYFDAFHFTLISFTIPSQINA